MLTLSRLVEETVSVDTLPMTRNDSSSALAEITEIPSCDCTVCLVPHDDEIHQATLNLREWFRYEVTKYFFEEEVPLDEEDSEFYLVA
jgi:hypothetical protein